MSVTAPTTPVLPHLLSLKVLRTAKPSTSSTSKYSFPFEELNLGELSIKRLENEFTLSKNSKSFNLTGELELPHSFGTIYLGETFSALLSISNDSFDSKSVALLPNLKVEMHTSGINNSGGSKHLLLTLNGGEVLNPGESKEGMVQHEIKELGMHALVCTVSYGARTLADGEGSAIKTVTRTFRKIFKFEVSNPLSVRTKAHSPHPLTSASNLSCIERDKVFLEVQIQNQGQYGIYFERMNFQPTVSFNCVDINHVTSTSTDSPPTGLFEGSSAILPINSVRQYLYVLSPVPNSIPALPGSSQPLGRLDIVWKTPHGETGRLQTSMLGRRVPLPTIPLHLSSSDHSNENQSPPIPAKELASPPSSNGLLVDITKTSPLPLTLIHIPDDKNLISDLTVIGIYPSKVNIEQIFEIQFNLEVKDRSALNPSSSLHNARRKIQLAAQFVKWTSENSPVSPLTTTTFELTNDDKVILPKPIRIISDRLNEAPTTIKSYPSSEIVKLGSTSLILPEFTFDFTTSNPTTTTTSESFSELDASTLTGGNTTKASIQVHNTQFSMKFLAQGTGLKRVGGIRILLVDSTWSSEVKQEQGERRAKVVLEVATVAEVWVGSESQ